MYARLTGSNAHEKSIINRCNNLKELKDELVHLANKFHCIEKQISRGSKEQFYLGDRFGYSVAYIDNLLHAINNIAVKMEYKIYSPNGAWFIKSI
jgi:hypothetical protein